MSLNSYPSGPSRRRILGTALGMAAGSFAARSLPAHAQSGSADLATRAIPHSRERIPVIGLGTANEFQRPANRRSKSQPQESRRRSSGQGCKLIDTASSYGAAESVLGDLLSDQDRSRVFLATKLENGDAKGRRGRIQTFARASALSSRSIFCNCIMCRIPTRAWPPFATGSRRAFAATSASPPRSKAIMTRRKPCFAAKSRTSSRSTTRWMTGKRKSGCFPRRADVGAAVLTALPFGRSSVFSAVRGKSVPEWAAEFDATTWPQFFLKFLLGHDAVTAVIPGTTNPAHLADNISAGRGRFPDAAQRQAMIKFFDSALTAGLRDRYLARNALPVLR